MKKFSKPELNVLDITETKHEWLGWNRDGGYIGDNIVSGHLTFDKDDNNNNGNNGGNGGSNSAPEERLS